MHKIYKSKLGLEIVVPVIFIFQIVLSVMLKDEFKWFVFILLIILILFIAYIFLNTNYTIDNNELKIKSGFLFKKTINIKSITKIIETNNPISSPATSLDRLEIRWGKNEFVIISPKQKQEFINHIKELNPNVEIKLKKNKI